MTGLVTRKARGAVLRTLNAVVPYWGAQVDWRMHLRRDETARRVIDAVVHPGDVVVDVGAHRGMFSARLQHLVTSTGHVYAVEPFSEHAPRLRRLSQRGNLTYLPVAASDGAGHQTLHVPLVDGQPHAGLASLHPHATPEKRVEVRLDTLDSLLADEMRPVKFLKIDVEGHEAAVIAGAQRVLKNDPALLIEIEQRHQEEPVSSVFDQLAERGFEGWGVYEDGLRALDLFDLERDQLRFLTGGFQDTMPVGYVNDFLFLPRGRVPPRELLFGNLA